MPALLLFKTNNNKKKKGKKDHVARIDLHVTQKSLTTK